MRRLAVLTALCALLCAPAAASAKGARFWIRGAGFGHGVGMSQYGANGMATVGRNYQQILAQYYRGTVVSLAQQTSIRVLLQQGRPRVTFSGATAAGSKALRADATYVATQSAGGILVGAAKGGRRVALFPGAVRVTSSLGYVQLGGGADNGVAGGTYRGALELSPGAGISVVNALPLDSYVRGVVPGEMPTSWLPEALKAQAVAARTYALMSDSGGPLFDVYADTRSQMYKGMSSEVASTNAATKDTSNQIVTYEGQPITTYFFSTSGGKTESVENAFYGATPVPYLRGVKDPYDGASPRHRWQLGPYTRARISAKLGGYCRGSFRALKIRKRGFSPRIVSADVVCSRGTVRTNGAALRSRLGLYDSWFTITSGAAKRQPDGTTTGGVFGRLIGGRSAASRLAEPPLTTR